MICVFAYVILLATTPFSVRASKNDVTLAVVLTYIHDHSFYNCVSHHIWPVGIVSKTLCIIISSVDFNSVCIIPLILQDYRGNNELRQYPRMNIIKIIILDTNNYCEHGYCVRELIVCSSNFPSFGKNCVLLCTGVFLSQTCGFWVFALLLYLILTQDTHAIFQHEC